MVFLLQTKIQVLGSKRADEVADSEADFTPRLSGSRTCLSVATANQEQSLGGQGFNGGSRTVRSQRYYSFLPSSSSSWLAFIFKHILNIKHLSGTMRKALSLFSFLQPPNKIGTFISTFYRWENWSLKKLCDLPTVGKMQHQGHFGGTWIPVIFF